MKSIEEIKKTRNLFIKAENELPGLAGYYYDSDTNKNLNFIFSKQFGWEHLSVSMPSRTPTWDQMCKMKDIFWNDDETCVEYHPAKDQYVNMHKHCLHIWKPVLDEQFMQEPRYNPKDELLAIPPHILVGFKDQGEKEAFLQMANIFGIDVNKWDYTEKDR